MHSFIAVLSKNIRETVTGGTCQRIFFSVCFFPVAVPAADSGIIGLSLPQIRCQTGRRIGSGTAPGGRTAADRAESII